MSGVVRYELVGQQKADMAWHYCRFIVVWHTALRVCVECIKHLLLRSMWNVFDRVFHSTVLDCRRNNRQHRLDRLRQYVALSDDCDIKRARQYVGFSDDCDIKRVSNQHRPTNPSHHRTTISTLLRHALLYFRIVHGWCADSKPHSIRMAIHV